MKWLNITFTLRDKIYGFAGLLFLFFVALNLLFFVQTNSIFSSHDASNQANSQIQKALEISGEIEKLQRHVQNYTYTGYLDSAEEARELYQNLFASLSPENFDDTPDIQDNFKNIRTHLDRYYLNFNELITQRGTQEQLRHDIRKLSAKINANLKQLTGLATAADFEEKVQAVSIQALEIENNIFRYYESLNNDYAKIARQKIKANLEQIQALAETPNLEHQIACQQLISDTQHLEKLGIHIL